MRRIGWFLRRVFQLAVAAGVLCLAAGPGAVRGRADALMAAAWRAAGEVLAGRGLKAISGEIDAARAELRRTQARRDALAGRLDDFKSRRSAASARAEQVRELLGRIADLLDRLPDGEDRSLLEHEAGWHLQRGLDAGREVAQLDAAVLALAEEIAHADRQIGEVQDRLSARESGLAVLRAEHEVRRLRRELAGLSGTPAPPAAAGPDRVAGLVLQPAAPPNVAEYLAASHKPKND